MQEVIIASCRDCRRLVIVVEHRDEGGRGEVIKINLWDPPRALGGDLDPDRRMILGRYPEAESTGQDFGPVSSRRSGKWHLCFPPMTRDEARQLSRDYYKGRD